jgi:PAS domain S-box-containing protein
VSGQYSGRSGCVGMLKTLIARAGSAQHDVERVLSKAVEFAPNGVALTTADGRILLTNAELERMFGYARTELLEQPIERLIPERFMAGHALLRAGDGKDAQLMGAGRELFGRRADGTEFPIEIGLSMLETSDGAMVVETIVDISVRKRLERMFQKMVEAAPCGMVMIEPRGRIVLVNPQMETMFGYDRVELIGAPLEMLLPERFRAAHGSHRRAFAAAPSMRQMGVGRDLTARRKDGSEFPVEIGLNPVPGEEGGLVLAAVADITRRKSMELELLQANANLEEFTYAASHDLKSPLRGISALIEWIGEDLGASASPEVVRNLGRVSQRIRRLEQIIEDLLKYARAGATSAEAVAVDPRSLLAEILEIQTVPPGFRIAVHIDSAPFVTSKTPLATALRNIIANAIKHHDAPDGNLEIRVEDVDRYCVFTVSDDGPGIPLAAQERAFRMFQTLAPAGGGGSGIGLALSKRLVESHGGRITLSSTDGVRGASFRVWWPRLLWVKEQ